MAVNYYLLNGKNGKGEALDILVDGKLQRNFIDIASLDLQTMEMDKSEKNDILREYNNKDLSGIYYIGSTPHKSNQIKTFAPIFDFTTDKSKEWLEELKYYAEERDFNKRNNGRVALDDTKDLEEYIVKLMHDVINTNNSNLLKFDCIIASALKDIIESKYKEHPTVGTYNYINSKLRIIKHILSGYTQLRNLTLTHMLYLEGYTINLRRTINKVSYWDNEGMNEKDPVPYDIVKKQIIRPKNYQMKLTDYINLDTGEKN